MRAFLSETTLTSHQRFPDIAARQLRIERSRRSSKHPHVIASDSAANMQPYAQVYRAGATALDEG